MRTSWSVRLKLLGFRSVIVHGRVVDLGSNKAIAILAYLALRKTAVLRSEIDGLLWPESDRYRARRSLREELSLLHRHLPEGVLRTTGQSVALDPSTAVDVWAFMAALSQGAWESATTLYSGDLLEGLYVRNAAGFESWLERERGGLQHRYLDALQVLCTKAVQAGEIGAALAYNHEIIATNPFTEAPYIRGMEWASRIGETAVALGLYHDLQMTLKREFGIAPSATAVALAKEIATDGFTTRARIAGTVGMAASGPGAESAFVKKAFLNSSAGSNE